jgi:hypothetical protein
MEWEFTDFDTGLALPEQGKLSPVRLAHEHRERWVLKTSKGDIVLRRMPLRLFRIIELARVKMYPRLMDMYQEIQELQTIPQSSEHYASAQERMSELATALVMSDPAPLGVIVSPSLASMDDYEELYTLLNAQERDRLITAVAEMTRVASADEIDPIPEMVAERMGLKLVTKDMIEHMTVSQAEYWYSRIQAEKTVIERMYRP